MSNPRQIDIFQTNSGIVAQASAVFHQLDALPDDEKIKVLNELRVELRKHSPFKNEPIECIYWIPAESVQANDYNPNSVAPPEMKLLEHSITEDGYTQPIVTWQNGDKNEVVDGFHRHRVGKESAVVRERIKGYLPVVVMNDDRTDRNDRMAATIRHNRARGKHKVDSMSEIVVELKRRFWSDEKIAKELGMEPDEVLRLQQITGLASLFADSDFSEAWEAESFADIDKEDGIEEIRDET